MIPIETVQGDLTRHTADALVNAANSSLLGGGGVDGALHRAGGPEILEACRELRNTTLPGGLPTGEAVATTPGRLPTAHLLHTVGPVYAKGEDRSALLTACHRNCLRLAEELEARTIAFPAISTGVYGWPMEDAARIAVAAVRAHTPRTLEKVTFVLFDGPAKSAFDAALAQ